MTRMKTRTCVLMLLALLALFAGCKGESPTSPTSNPTPPSGGPVTPATGVTIALSASSTQPQVDSSSVITANVTQNGAAVPNGTAVEFTTNLGTFTEANGSSIIRTTTNGVATVTLASSVAGTATVTATVSNVSKTTNVTFNLKPVVTPPPDLTPQITSISPQVGIPQGGQILTITGKNFSNAKVIFDFGGGKTVEAFPVSQNSTTIQVLTPSVDLGTGQQKTANVIVINNVGTANEVRVTAPTTFTFQAEVLTPSITTISPASGPIDGGTRVTIFGEGFQAPIQVFFGNAEASLAAPVTFNQLVVLAPKAGDTAPAGSGNVTGGVDIKVININSNKSTTSPTQFRYVKQIQVTAVGPTVGPSEGGTRIEVNGDGFNDPVTVTTAGVAANIISVSGSKIIAITSPVALTSCNDVTGPIGVTNIENGDSATGPTWTYRVAKTAITFVTPQSVTAGGNVDITVSGQAGGVNKVVLGDQTAFVTSTTVNANGTTTLHVTVPTNFTFPSAVCTTSGGIAGTNLGSLKVNIAVTNIGSTCNDTATNGLTVLPSGANPCVVPPPPSAVVTPGGATCADAGSASVGASATSTTTITISNTGGQPLIVSGAAISGANAGDFTISPSNATVTANGAQTFTITFKPTATGARAATVTFTTNDPVNGTITKCVNGNGLP